ncbi:hypothetical protein GCM10023334_098210 [Nonomuraea thailandensis]
MGTTLVGPHPVLPAGAGNSLARPSGPSPDAQVRPGPGLDLVAELAREVPVPVIAEGRYHLAEQAAEAVGLGAHAVIGTAITHPTTITRWFATAVAR